MTTPERARVDLAEPSFSNPTTITNPLFPIGDLTQVVQLGEEAGAKLRFEVTVLPETKVIEWNGQQIETRASQFVGYQDGRVLEVARDFFAQADDGAVWYFGEDVFNYKDGVVDNNDGTWLAGKDGPPGMIMPSDPQVGDVYRPENIPGFVFEEVTVKSAGKTVDGPRGQVEGAVVVEELLMDGLREGKTFAPGYGEFHFAVAAEKELVDMALAVPTDAVSAVVPAQLSTVSTGADDIFRAAPSEDWGAISSTVDTMTSAWDTYQAGDVPKLLDDQISDALDALAAAVDARDPAATGQAAIDVAEAGLDLQLQHRASAEVDRARLALWSRQVLVDAAARDAAAVTGDIVILETIRDRVVHTIGASQAAQLDAQLSELRTAAAAADVEAAAEIASTLQATLNA